MIDSYLVYAAVFGLVAGLVGLLSLLISTRKQRIVLQEMSVDVESTDLAVGRISKQMLTLGENITTLSENMIALTEVVKEISTKQGINSGEAESLGNALAVDIANLFTFVRDNQVINDRSYDKLAKDIEKISKATVSEKPLKAPAKKKPAPKKKAAVAKPKRTGEGE